MDAAALNPRTPERPASAELSPPRRNSMEDSDTTTTRKRPRLDSGDRTYRSMSAERTTPSRSSDESAQALYTPPSDDSLDKIGDKDNAVSIPIVELTPSKVTINVRDPSQITLPSQHDGTSTDPAQDANKPVLSHEIPPSPHADSPPLQVISVSSSPPHSPEIEVAEVEDMNQESGETRWRSLASVIESRESQVAIMDDFPESNGGRNLLRAVAVISQTLERDDLDDGLLLKRLTKWIESYLTITERRSSEWWEIYVGARKFWDQLPNIPHRLLQRNSTRLNPAFVSPLHNTLHEDNRHYVKEFFVMYTRLASRMLQLDCQILKQRGQDYDIGSVLVSWRYLQILLYLGSPNLIPLWKTLVDVCRYDWKSTTNAIFGTFIEEPSNGVWYLSQYVQGILEGSHTTMNLTQWLSGPLTLVAKMMVIYSDMQDGEDDIDHRASSSLRALPVQAHELFQLVDATLQKYVSKQNPILSLDLSKTLVTDLSQLLRQIALADEGLARSLLSENLPSIPNLDMEETCTYIEMAWKFRLLKECITEGRMEIRVQGVETMQGELVNIYQKYVRNVDNSGTEPGKHHPIAQFLSDFVLVSKLVEYIVGVESHPQLIQRSGNIIGFLIVTDRYTNAESDAIWKTVATSQDSRVTDAILTQLKKVIFNISPYSNLLYLTTKLDELPLHMFDTRMINYGATLFENLRHKCRELRQRMDMPPYHLCIRLIRQAAAGDSLSQQRMRDITEFALSELEKLLKLGPSDEDRSIIFDQCVKDVALQSPSCTGSIHALNALVAQNPETHIKALARTANISSLMVGDFIRVTKAGHSHDASPSACDESLAVRLTTLEGIIVFVPETISADLGSSLWNAMVGSDAVSHWTRNKAWSTLHHVLHHSPTRNSFIDQCIKNYIPRLDPALLTMGTLEFVKGVEHYESRFADVPENLAENVGSTTSAELLWHISLIVPVNTIEVPTIEALVTYYLDRPRTTKISRSIVEASHKDFVERCILKLSSAASLLKTYNHDTPNGEDDSMAVVSLSNEVEATKLLFSRSLLILKELVRGIRARPLYSPPMQAKASPSFVQEIKGESLCIRYQPYSGGRSTGIQSVELGNLNTVADLLDRLTVVTKFSKFTTIANGQKLDLTSAPDMRLGEIKINGLLIVKEIQDSLGHVPASKFDTGLSSLELDVVMHFPKLYELLGIENAMARDVYDFLTAFPPDETLTAFVCSMEVTADTAFPPEAPFKTMYSIYALRHRLDHLLQNANPSQDLICHGVRILGIALTRVKISLPRVDSETDVMIAIGLVDCLLRFLKGPVPQAVMKVRTLISPILEPISPSTPLSYIPNGSLLADRLFALISTALSTPVDMIAANLGSLCFRALLEASLHSQDVWNQFSRKQEAPLLLQKLLLGNSAYMVREGAADAIRALCGTLPTPTSTSPQELTLFFWKTLVKLVPIAATCGHQAQHFFDITLVLFRSLETTVREEIPLETFIEQWSGLLLKHTHDEFVGRSSTDWVVSGISNLLQWCLQLAKSLKRPVEIGNDVMERIFYAHLFPRFADGEELTQAPTRVPVLQSSTRRELYSLLLALSSSLPDYQKLLHIVQDLAPQGEDSQAWSWGVAQIVEDYRYEPNWNIDRPRIIRSDVGYPGLKNLSNTCYLNSLFTQLFMNVSFRSFMLEVNITDPRSSQRLLHETRNLFAFMQNTWAKAADPQGIADSVVTCDNAPIDTSIQMDVDEFYYLLLDRWESQIISPGAQKAFRQFYGGQLVQQVKSKECPHISERLEPFSAIQLDIQGKANLMDSLVAYVEGEILEGGNKYSCTSCGAYVDAVKRECLKDIPDNLIFHLKRFDFDVMTGTRSKINDRFEFPEQVDMAPFDVESLKDPSQQAKPDMFQLVGVLVHSGTAEQGHYYSYIRERPVAPTQTQSWLEFNDQDVTRFDPANIPDQCFGGIAENTPFVNMRYPKAWNAYMLFYQRSGALESEHQRYDHIAVDVPVTCKLPADLEDWVSRTNEQFIRKYCLLDPEHAIFVKTLLDELRNLTKGSCSDDHDVEKQAICVALGHLDRVYSRTKDNVGFDPILGSLAKVISTCPECCKLALDWVVEHKIALRNLLLRCPAAKVRHEFAKMIFGGLQYLRKHEPRLYGFDVETMDQDPVEVHLPEVPGAFHNVIKALDSLWIYLPTHAKAWDNYFGLLTELANLGIPESHAILREGFLKYCFEILLIDNASNKILRAETHHYASYLRLLEKGRKYSFTNLLELLSVLLCRIDLELNPCGQEYEDRQLDQGKLPLTLLEEAYFTMGQRKQPNQTLFFLDKVIVCDQNRHAASKIVETMVLAEPTVGVLDNIERTILSGMNIDPATLAVPYINAALVFCQYCPDVALAKHMISQIAQEVDTIGVYGGREHLEFFLRARHIQNVRLNRGPMFFENQVLRSSHLWAPPLLMYWEDAVRSDTIGLLQSLVFHKPVGNDQQASEFGQTARKLCSACVKRLSTVFQHGKSIDGKNVQDAVHVVRYCLETYYDANASAADEQMVHECEIVLESVQSAIVSDVEDNISDNWDNGSDPPTDSESEFLQHSPEV